jgi:hypothetical protein
MQVGVRVPTPPCIAFGRRCFADSSRGGTSPETAAAALPFLLLETLSQKSQPEEPAQMVATLPSEVDPGVVSVDQPIGLISWK